MFSRVNVYFSQFLPMFHIFLTRSSERCVSDGHFGTLVSRVGFICWELDFLSTSWLYSIGLPVDCLIFYVLHGGSIRLSSSVCRTRSREGKLLHLKCSQRKTHSNVPAKKELTDGSVEQTVVDMLRRQGVDDPGKHDDSEESEEQAAAVAVSSRVTAGL